MLNAGDSHHLMLGTANIFNTNLIYIRVSPSQRSPCKSVDSKLKILWSFVLLFRWLLSAFALQHLYPSREWVQLLLSEHRSIP